MHVFEENVPCVSPQRVDGNLDSIRHFVAARDGVSCVPFWRAIRALQSPEVVLAPTHGGPRLIWDRFDEIGVSSALRDLMALKTLDPHCAYTDCERRRRQLVVRDGLWCFRQYFPDTYPVFRHAVPFLILAKKDAHVGGCVSNRIGFVWLAPSSSWTGRDCGEYLYHEYIHQCLFIEDMTRTLFRRDPPALSEPESMIVSAVRGVPRRYDQSYHSAFVAAGVVEYRARASDFDGARALLANLWLCLHALVRKSVFLTSNGAEQLDRLVECVFRQADDLGVGDRFASTVR